VSQLSELRFQYLSVISKCHWGSFTQLLLYFTIQLCEWTWYWYWHIFYRFVCTVNILWTIDFWQSWIFHFLQYVSCYFAGLLSRCLLWDLVWYCTNLIHLCFCLHWSTGCTNKKQSHKKIIISLTVTDFFHQIYSIYREDSGHTCSKFHYSICCVL